MAYISSRNLTAFNTLIDGYMVGDRVYCRRNGVEGVVKFMTYCSDPTFPSNYKVSVAMDDGAVLSNFCASDFWPVNAANVAKVPDITYIPINFTVSADSTKKSIDHYPHRCPKCNGKAFIGFNRIDCMFGCYR